MTDDKEYLRTLLDWDTVIHDLARSPIIWDQDAADVIGDGWRGATLKEIQRISQVFINAMIARHGDAERNESSPQ